MTTHDASTPTSSNESATPTANATAKSPAAGRDRHQATYTYRPFAGPPIDLNIREETNQPGVIAFIHPNSVCNATSLAGMRAALRDEFTDIYVVDLLGDAMKSEDERSREGQVIFGIEIRETSEVRKGTGVAQRCSDHCACAQPAQRPKTNPPNCTTPKCPNTAPCNKSLTGSNNSVT